MVDSDLRVVDAFWVLVGRLELLVEAASSEDRPAS